MTGFGSLGKDKQFDLGRSQRIETDKVGREQLSYYIGIDLSARADSLLPFYAGLSVGDGDDV